jgi:hypothetical protein
MKTIILAAIIIIIAFVSIKVYTQTKEELFIELRKTRSELNSSEENLLGLYEKYPLYQINGEIEDNSDNLSVIRVWGTAVPLNSDYNSYGALLKKGNIVIQNPNKENVKLNSYVSGAHYFIQKKYGKNKLGGDVPIFIYGDKPADIIAEEKRINNINNKFIPIRNKYLNIVLKTKYDFLNEKVFNENFLDEIKILDSFKKMVIGSNVEELARLGGIKYETANIDLFIFAKDGVIVFTDKEKIIAITFVLQNELMKKYFSLFRKYEITDYKLNTFPLIVKKRVSTLLSKLYTIEQIQNLKEYPELHHFTLKSDVKKTFIKRNIENDNEYYITCRKDDDIIDFISITLFNQSVARINYDLFPLYLTKADSDGLIE